jgi:hypothetical protein
MVTGGSEAAGTGVGKWRLTLLALKALRDRLAPALRSAGSSRARPTQTSKLRCWTSSTVRCGPLIASDCRELWKTWPHGPDDVHSLGTRRTQGRVCARSVCPFTHVNDRICTPLSEPAAGEHDRRLGPPRSTGVRESPGHSYVAMGMVSSAIRTIALAKCDRGRGRIGSALVAGSGAVLRGRPPGVPVHGAVRSSQPGALDRHWRQGSRESGHTRCDP